MALAERPSSWPIPLPVAEVLWRDTHSHGSWRDMEELHADGDDIFVARSFGLLVRNDSKAVVIAQSVSRTGAGADTVVIPRADVIGLRIIEKPAERWDDAPDWLPRGPDSV